ncbi:hypothetical protein SKAU_G00011360 [Synaphobranchus kaupii]|uniref:Uncharacterized protein n=1 Tax=Synaphobranchus kaupii TaxID=118154 RepID=A0A9Q1GB72_SYNKA|nr:hypothetical protein SKAU_G00011360 [Synaphobranchus kaupii]
MEDSEGNKEGPCRAGAQKTPQVSEECVLLRRLLLGLENMESRMDRMEEQLKEIAAMFSGGEGCLAQPQVQEEEERGKEREEEEVGNEKAEEGGEKGVERRKEERERVEEEEKGEVNEKNEEEGRKKGRSVWKLMKVKWQRKRREEEGGRKEEGKRDKEDPGEGTSGSEPEGKEADEVRVNVKEKKTMKGLWSSLKRRWQGRRTEEVQEGEKEKIVAALVRTRTAHVVDLNIVFGSGHTIKLCSTLEDQRKHRTQEEKRRVENERERERRNGK